MIFPMRFVIRFKFNSKWVSGAELNQTIYSLIHNSSVKQLIETERTALSSSGCLLFLLSPRKSNMQFPSEYNHHLSKERPDPDVSCFINVHCCASDSEMTDF